MSNNSLEDTFNFFAEAGELKREWRFRDLPEFPKDSVAAHCWRLSVMADYLINEYDIETVNLERVKDLCMYHDLAEAKTGDIDVVKIANGEVKQEDKDRGELKAMNEFKTQINSKSMDRIYNLWIEFEEQETNEAKFVKALDRLEAISTIIEGGNSCIDEPDMIAMYADEYIEKVPELIPYLNHLKGRLKPMYEELGLEWKTEYNKL